MDITAIPFVEKLGITRGAEGVLELPFNRSVENHLGTLAASAQFALAETASGELLQVMFPELVGKVIPVLRDCRIKYKKAALKSITAYPRATDEVVALFKEQLARKGRASIAVDVEVRDTENTITCIGAFNWFVQRVE